jgi:hypothetical protein
MGKKDDILVGLMFVGLVIGVLAVLFGVRYAWLNYTPCSFHSVKDAPVRCLNPTPNTLLERSKGTNQ